MHEAHQASVIFGLDPVWYAGTLDPHSQAGVNGHVEVPTGGQQKSPPLEGVSQLVGIACRTAPPMSWPKAATGIIRPETTPLSNSGPGRGRCATF